LRGQTTAEFLSNNSLQVAVNGDYFYPFHSDSIFSYYPHSGDPVTVEGIGASDGTIYSNQTYKSKFPTLYISKNNSATFNRTRYPIYNAISGLCMLVKDGNNLYSNGGGTSKPEPNTAVALDRKGSKLMIFVVDGRQSNFSGGVTFKEFADIIRSYGGWSAMDLDGGGSETLVAQGVGGVPITLNYPIDCRIPGRERVVANHLGVRALKLPRP